MSDRKKASILIVSGNINNRNAVECISAVKKNTRAEDIREIIILEAGIRPDFNHAKEINKAIKIFDGDYLVIMDDDAIVEPGWLQGLIECAEADEKTGVVGAVLKNSRGQIIHTGADVTDTYFGFEFSEPIKKPVERRYVCSAVMLITRAAIEKVGLFDENFMKYGQDADYCFRTWEARLMVLCTPNANAIHKVGGTFNLRKDTVITIEHDKNYFYDKWRKSAFYNNYDLINLSKRGVSYPTYACNIKCCFCYYHFKTENKHRSLDEMKHEMDLFREEYGLEYVDISGGEPTVYKHIRELVSYCTSTGIYPTIITNGQKPDVYNDLIDAGLEDILISIHGYREDCNRAMGREDAYDNVSKTIERLNERKFSFRTNTTILDFNYSRLPKLAVEMLQFGPRISNFISFNPHEGTDWSKKDGVDFQAKYSEIAPYLKETIDILMEAGIWVNVRYIPLCIMKGYEKHVCNFHQWQWDPYEWDYFSGHRLDKKELQKIKKRANREKSFGRIPEERIKNWITKHWSCANNVYFEECSDCANRHICDGVYPQYIRRFGNDEFVPSEGEQVFDPLFYRKKNQLWRVLLTKTKGK